MTTAKRKAATPLKQGNLFSFFTKKSNNSAPAPKQSSPPVKTPLKSSTVANTPSSSPRPPLNNSTNTLVGPARSRTNIDKKATSASVPKPPKLQLKTRIDVFWPDDDEYYRATVIQIQTDNSSKVYLQYDDGEREWLDLSSQEYKIVGESDANVNKKRRILEDNDGEESEDAEFEGGLESDNEAKDPVYTINEAASDHEDDDDDDQWMVTDDEDDESAGVTKKQRSAKKNVKVTMHDKFANKSNSTKTSNPLSPALRTPTSSPSTQVTPRFSSFSATKAKQTTSSAFSTVSTDSPVSRRSASTVATTPSTALTVSPSTSTTSACQAPLAYVRNAVNPAGSHVHNHLKFLQNPKDKQKRTPGDPDYDPRSLYINHADWERHCGKMTAAVQQWWELKAQYFDTVLLFKTGKFYEMVHMDADIGVHVCSLSYMKGHCAHAGFPEISYGTMAEKLVRAGYKVARVEQTETPQMLAERKKQRKGQPALKVVNREVCSILTLGTRTFCYLDDVSGLDNGQSSNGPLLSIKEVLLQPIESNGEQVLPVCEYGITIVDAIHGVVTIGQFADDVLRSRMDTLLSTFSPSEILLSQDSSPTLLSLIKAKQKTHTHARCNVEIIRDVETFPKSTAIDNSIRILLQRPTSQVKPWEVDDTLTELHRRQYFPASSKNKEKQNVSRWPPVLKAAVEGGAALALSSLGATLFYLQRNLIDQEILSMGNVKAYVPPSSSTAVETNATAISALARQQAQGEVGEEMSSISGCSPNLMDVAVGEACEDAIDHLALDGTTLHNLDILYNSADHKVAGSLWSKINFTQTPHGARLLRTWLLRPLFRSEDIGRRADAVQELSSGGAAVAMADAVKVLSKCGDIERLLSRVHSMSGTSAPQDNDSGSVAFHPNDRAVLFETATYTKRKVGDFSKLLCGLQYAAQIPELFCGVQIQSPMLAKIVNHPSEGGCFPVMAADLEWFSANFDCEQAAKGVFEPSRGVDALYDDANDVVSCIESDLAEYKEELCSNALKPRSVAQSSWKYVNTKPESKDKYLIELPASVQVPDDFIMKGKRGSGSKQINKYRTMLVEQLVLELESALDILKERKARGMQLIFAKFDSMRNTWSTAAQATAMLDALGSLAQTASKPGYTRPIILDCPSNGSPCIKVTHGRHPCIERLVNTDEFIPNDLSLGCNHLSESNARVLLLSGPNMGGKSTLLRQTCLIAIMAQIGSFVPAAECQLTPMDRIFTRLGASDRILLGQSTFFVELAETAAALRGASRRSLVIMDELGRGTSTFDGTAIASATVKHLIERSQCLSLFATHYHSLLEEWKSNSYVRLGHMECIVVGDDADVHADNQDDDKTNITFLYTLGGGVCPKSFGINVARLAGLPEDVLAKAKSISTTFESRLSTAHEESASSDNALETQRACIVEALESGNWEELSRLWSATQ